MLPNYDKGLGWSASACGEYVIIRHHNSSEKVDKIIAVVLAAIQSRRHRSGRWKAYLGCRLFFIVLKA